MIPKKEKIEVEDTYWWLGPLGVIFVILLIAVAMIRGAQMPLDELGTVTRNKIKSTLTGRNRQAIWLGMEISPASKANAREFGIRHNRNGVVITDIDNGQGADAGLNIGDVIVAVNGSKVTDFDSFLWLAKQSKFSDGIFLDVLTNGRKRYVSMPFHFEGGPMFGPNTNHWQLGAPVTNSAMGYGKLAAFTNNNQQQVQNMGLGGNSQSFLICPNCGHSTIATSPNPQFCPNDGLQMMRNQ